MADSGFHHLLSLRLILRRLRDSDLPAFCAYRSDPHVARYQDWESWSREETRRLLAAQRTLDPDVRGTWFQLAIELAETGALIGDCGLYTLSDWPGQAAPDTR
jgi:RimJ/RimL family protein N-acetyltransferase